MNQKKNEQDRDFWAQLRTQSAERNAPFFALAPMYDVTDVAFRQMFVRYGKPDVMYTEFTSAEGIIHSIGGDNIKHLLWHEDNEAPLVAHLFSARPEAMRRAAAHVARLGFDGIDINMGCPVKNIQKQGCGAAMICNPDNAVAVLEAARAGVADAGRDIPVSVKTRIGYTRVEEWRDWLSRILAAHPAALAVHLRTKKEMSDVPAHWELMPEVVVLRDTISPETVLIGNGDVTSMDDGVHRARESGCDGIMVGRGVFGNPWFFNRKTNGQPPSVYARLSALKEHLVLYGKYFDGVKNFDVMKHHFKAYTNGFNHASQLRAFLMETTSALEACAIIDRFIVKHDINK